MDPKIAKALDALCAPFGVADGDRVLAELRRRVEIAKGLRHDLREAERRSSFPADLPTGFLLDDDSFDFSRIEETSGPTKNRPKPGPRLVKSDGPEAGDPPPTDPSRPRNPR
jgi:hypothetical protein